MTYILPDSYPFHSWLDTALRDTSGKARNNQDFDHRIPGATLRLRIVDRAHTFPVYSFIIAVIGVG